MDATGTVCSFNASAERIFGIKAAEIVGKNCDVLFESVEGLSRTDGPLNLTSLDVGTHDARGRHVSGSRPNLELAVTDMEHENGRHLVVLARDVTEIKRQEREMNRLARKYAQVAAGIEATTTGVVLTDPNRPDNPVVFVNPAFSAMSGYGHEEVLGRAFGMLVGDETDPASLKAIESAISRQRSVSLEALYHKKDGATFWTQIQLNPVRDDYGNLEYYVWILNDISEKKQYETELISARDEAISANRMKSEFLAAMSHELRTPLNAIMGFSEMIEGEVFGPLGDAKYCGYVSDIRGSASHLHAIIMDILDMAKIESGKFELIEEEIAAKDAITACIRIVRARAIEANLELVTDISDDLPKFRADSRVFKQILRNILSNAIKFTPAGGRVSVVAGLRADGGISVSVTDTGIGMTDSDLKIALKPFAQVDGELSRKYEGTGLGLPLAKNFVELLGGMLEISSEAGKGTRVTFSIPCARILADSGPPEAAAVNSGAR